MKKMLFTTVAVLGVLGASAASAQDWAGFHAGVNLGLAGDHFDYPFTADIPPVAITGEANLNSSGAVGGVQAGYDWQVSDRWVLGLEADLNASDVTGEVAVHGAAAGAISGDLTASVGSELDYFGTARVRLGYAYERLLPYVTAGVAFGDVTSGYDLTVNSGGSPLFAAADSVSSNESGWTAGAGFEYRFADNFSLKTEYLYVDLGESNLIDVPVGGGSATLDVATAFHVVRAGLNYRF